MMVSIVPVYWCIGFDKGAIRVFLQQCKGVGAFFIVALNTGEDPPAVLRVYQR